MGKMRNEKQKSKQGRRSRRKGHQFERDIAIELRSIGFPGARRQLEYHSRDALGVDIQEAEPFKIQCKKLRTYVPVNTIYEIQCERDLGDIPIVITAADKEEPMAILPWSDLKRMIKVFSLFRG